MSGTIDGSSPDISIRSYKSGDAGYLAHRHGVLYAQEYGLDTVFESYVIIGMAKFFESGRPGNIWVAECGDRIVGGIAMVSTAEDTAQLRWFLIEPEYRGIGLGRRMMDVAMAFCRDNGFVHVYLWTFCGLDAACHLYQQYGFRATEQKDNHTWKNQLTEEKWELEL